MNNEAEVKPPFIILRFITRRFPILARGMRYLRPHRVPFFWALVAMSLFGATDGIIPYLLKRILDDVFGSQNKQMLYVLLGAIVAFACLRGIFGFMQKYLIGCVGLNIVRDLRNDIYRKLLVLSPGFFLRNSTGNLIARVTNDTLLVKSAVTDAVAMLLRDTVRVIALVVAAFVLDPFLATIAVIGLPIALAPVIKFGRKVRKLSRMGQDRFGGLTALLHESITGHDIIQSFTKEEYEAQRFMAENEHFAATYRRAEKYGALATPTNEVLASLLIGGVILYGGMSVISGVRSQGQFIAFITTMFLLYEPFKKLSNVSNTLQAGSVAAERIFEVIDAKVDIVEAPDAVPLAGEQPSIEFQDLSFRYPKRGEFSAVSTEDTGEEVEEADGHPWAVHNVSLAVAGGQTLALVGQSGSGKSTLLKLLPRFFDPQLGSVRINGRDIREYQLKSLRQAVSVVSQNTFLFNDTVFNNIAYGSEAATQQQVEEAARAANAESFINSLPQGYQTVVGEQGFTLSGGERARLSIARALLKNSPILILDEATANLDSQSEQLVQAAIERLMTGRTVLVIAHRLATVRNADKIAVLRHGELVEIGTHDELLARGGEYTQLYRLQFREDDDGLDLRVANAAV